jgi:SAM-dependent methyltransferase
VYDYRAQRIQESVALDRARTQAAYDRMAATYDTLYSGRRAKAENESVRLLLEPLVLRVRGSEGAVLDLGCGTGLFLELFDDLCASYVGVDISEGMLARAEQKFPLRAFVRADMCNIGKWGLQGFDLVVSLFGAMSHLPDIAPALESMRRSLRPGGRFFVMLCGLPSRHEETHVVNIAKQYAAPLHARYWTAEEAREAFAPYFGEVSVLGHGLRPCGASARLLALEALTLGALRPNWHYGLIVQGVK